LLAVVCDYPRMAVDLGEWEPYDDATVARLFEMFAARWWLSGGVALDRFVGYRTRPHADVDVSVRRDDWPAVETRLRSVLDVHIAQDGVLTPIAHRPFTDDVHNLWAREQGGGPWKVQVNLEPGDAERWIYRRDAAVSRPWPEAVVRLGGTPCVAPAVQLLWKAKQPRPHDDADFDLVFPLLSTAERSWLAGAVAVAHPESPWLTRLR
jgi:hypothetical protein